MQLIVGHIGRAHGIRGEVSVHVRTDEPEARFVPGAVFTTEAPEPRRGDPAPGAGPAGGVPFTVPPTLTVESLRWHQGRAIVVFDGVYDRNVAEALRGTLLCVDSADVPPPEDPDEFHDHQLVGLRVESLAGEVLGDVARIEHAPASDLLVLRRPGGRTALVPFVSQIVPRVDVAGGRVVVDLPDGLLDL